MAKVGVFGQTPSVKWIPNEEEKKTMETLKKRGLFIYRDFLTMGEALGGGFFGSVRRASLNYPLPTTVAVKTLSINKNVTLRKEAWILLKHSLQFDELEHDNLVKVIGISIKANGCPDVVLPYMENKDLHSYITDPEKKLSVGQLLNFGLQVARGMEHLSSHQIVHRDLAARNCLLDERLVVKISEFGLSRSLHQHSSSYYLTTNKTTPLPLRWMAVESITHNKFTSKSDVWSYGVVLWELMTRGKVPYVELDMWDCALQRFLMKGKRLEEPLICPKIIYKLMQDCWTEYPDARPSFYHIVNFLKILC